MAHIFDPLPIRGITLPNRIGVSPMCQYSSEDGFANDWHLVHLGSRAAGGAGLVFVEATAVTAEGRITAEDMGIWKDAHIDFLARIVRFMKSQGTVPGMQIAHAGRKGSTQRPWEGNSKVALADGGWVPVAPSAVSFSETYPMPRALEINEIHAIVDAFAAAARRALQAGFQVLEIHAAHGYLAHEFFSPLSNFRTDEYGGSFENRTRIGRDIVTAVRKVWPESLPLFIRISAQDWKEGGWDLDQSVELAKQLKKLGVDLVDCSSAGLVVDQKIAAGPCFQVPFAERIRRDANVLTATVGLIETKEQVSEILARNQADLVLMAREFLRDPYWPLRTARELKQPITWPAQYLRAATADTKARMPIADAASKVNASD
ncbi:MAG TPA: NADH:flavin oxidoreductase/NADH oxidase [Candidatus Saccharimonadales bacterium]|jgi:2,4-dienoyl-CoA reductase-like NADH-dependent reductase (Old Yellow Enzyme family)|nr:NADH:flavin oxidoreductase/NADH oxidase [Candidatus Saccharimonadales bacterium]